jgi:hypothetical protein
MIVAYFVYYIKVRANAPAAMPPWSGADVSVKKVRKGARSGPPDCDSVGSKSVAISFLKV